MIRTKNKIGSGCSGLLYHNVGPIHPGTNPALTISPERFERQVSWLAERGYVGVRPSEWLRWRKEGVGLPRRSVFLTFDDAYEDLDTHALPILLQYGFSAAVYVVTERLGATNTWVQSEGSGVLRLMSAKQIQYWAQKGIEFGAHSRTHSDLTRLTASECFSEVAGSKSDLAAVLGSPVASFAYPYGYYNDSTCKLVRSEYDLAFSVDQGLNYLDRDPHLLRRTYVGPNDSLLEFSIKVRRGGMPVWLQEFRIKLAWRARLKGALKYLTEGRTHRS